MSNSTENTITCIFLTKHLAIYKKMLTFAHIITDKEWR
ncbi:unknown [Prevotella sp. CAG:5226]|nr:unknown [Prevotella sp. CAG:5226]